MWQPSRLGRNDFRRAPVLFTQQRQALRQRQIISCPAFKVGVVGADGLRFLAVFGTV